MMENSNTVIENGQFNLAIFLKQNFLILLGFLVLLIPTIINLVNSIWKSDDQAHGPIILAIVIWLFWQVKDKIAKINTTPNPILGFMFVISALFIYTRSFSIDFDF